MGLLIFIGFCFLSLPVEYINQNVLAVGWGCLAIVCIFLLRPFDVWAIINISRNFFFSSRIHISPVEFPSNANKRENGGFVCV
jgi:NhaP-type Na+/H+ or K+/H+ antiporter